jgi:hypothetical protein
MQRGVPARFIAAFFVVFGAASCTAATSPTPGPPAASAVALATSTTSPTGSPTPTPVLPAVSPAGATASAAGVMGVHWTKSKGQPDVLATDANATDPPDGITDFGWQVFGWSRGYVAFHQVYTFTDETVSLIMDTSYSTDGLHWTPGKQLDLTDSASGESGGTSGFNGITGVVEGPAGLLAYSLGAPDCGSILVNGSVWPVAISPDGINWRLVNVDAHGRTVNENLFGHSVGGGPAGYITAGTDGIYTSTDGLTWTATDVKSAAFKGFTAIEAGTSIDGGFVVAGASKFPVMGCDGSGSPAALTPSVWWSPDGSTWARQTLPNAARGEDIDTLACRMGDHLLIATDTNQSWASTDGRTWKPISNTIGSLCFTDYFGASATVVLTVGDRTLVLSTANDDTTTIYALGDDLTLAKLTQTGTLPPDGMATAVLGPAGLVVADNEGNTYVGALVTA